MGLIEIGIIIGLCLFAYLLCSVPFGYILSWAKGVNIQKVGSGNIGGTNVQRALGIKYAIWVASLDLWKGAVPVTLAIYLFNAIPWVVGLVFLCCMLGAIFSIWLKFKTGSFRAGKGIAVFLGGLIVLAGWQWLVVISIWAIVFLFFVRRKMSAASLMLTAIVLFFVVSIPILIYISPMLLIIIGLIWWAHRENIQRLMKNEEPSIKINLPWLLDKIPDDIVGWTIEKLELFIKKLQNINKK